jgi:hypothetical protein
MSGEIVIRLSPNFEQIIARAIAAAPAKKKARSIASSAPVSFNAASDYQP